MALVGCGQRKPAVSDEHFAAFRQANPAMTKQCLDAYRYGGDAAWRPDDPDCLEMLPPQRWSGVWNAGWEWSNFCPEPAKECGISADQGDIWLTFTDRNPEPHGTDGQYQIEFIGRRTKDAGHFGHLNQYDHLMVVDKLISIRKVAEAAKGSKK